MAQIVDTIMQVLCQQGTASQCFQHISQYNDVTQQIVWLVFFPTVFLLLFIILISDGVVKNAAKKYKGILAIAIYLFIIFQGWYHYVLTVSTYWFIGIIVLGGLYVFTHKMGVAGGEGGGSEKKKGASWIRHAVLGSDQSIDPRKIAKYRKDYEDQIETLRKKRKDLEDDLEDAKSEREHTMLKDKITSLNDAITELEQKKHSGLPLVRKAA